MEKVAFIGGYDKTELILQIGRVLTLMGNKVLFVDTSAQQKTRYTVPTMKPSAQYITDYFDVSIAVGFKTMDEISSYCNQIGIQVSYDYVLYDIDNPYYYTSFAITSECKHFFVTNFDVYSVRRGLSCLMRLPQTINMYKVYFTKNMIQEEDDYVNYISKGLPISWNEDIIFFPFETQDLDAIFTNQRKQRIRFNGLSNTYVDSTGFICEIISGKSQNDVRKAIKKMD